MARSLSERIIGLIADHMETDPDEIDEATFLSDDLGADPYVLEEIANLMADEFEIEITEDDYESWETVGDVVQLVAEKLEENEEE
ncbi:acyl carrier protein [bacterium]|nr:acyl carrier protein [bacterium]